MTKLTELKEQYDKLGDKIKAMEEEKKVGAYGIVANPEGGKEHNVDMNLLRMDFLTGKFEAARECLGGQESFTINTTPQAKELADALNVWMELCTLDGAEEELDVEQYNIYHSICDEGFTVSNYIFRSGGPFAVYFPTRRQAQAAIDKLGTEKLNKLFMIGD